MTYLGATIYPKRFNISNFNKKISKIENLINFCGNQHISQADNIILINSTLMALPSYLINVYPIPDSVLDHIAKAARKFLWSTVDMVVASLLLIG